MFNRKSRNTAYTPDAPTEVVNQLLAGVGPRVTGDPSGILRFERLPEALWHAEKELEQFDLQQIGELGGPPAQLVRPAADVERLLLAHVGFDVPADLETECTGYMAASQMPGGGIIQGAAIRRRWPALEDESSRDRQTIPQVSFRFGDTAQELARLVSRAHADAVDKIRAAIDEGDLDAARDWCDALAAHCEHPIVDAR